MLKTHGKQKIYFSNFDTHIAVYTVYTIYKRIISLIYNTLSFLQV